MQNKLLLILVIILFFPIQGNAQNNNYPNALTMREWCKGIENGHLTDDGGIVINIAKYPNANKCVGAFIVLQMELTALDSETYKPAFFPGSCPSNGISRIQSVKVFTHYVDEHPETSNENFVGIVIQSFNKAWPCKN